MNPYEINNIIEKLENYKYIVSTGDKKKAMLKIVTQLVKECVDLEYTITENLCNTRHTDDANKENKENKESSFIWYDDPDVKPLNDTSKSINSHMSEQKISQLRQFDDLIRTATDTVRSLKSIHAPKEEVVNAVNNLKEINESLNNFLKHHFQNPQNFGYCDF